MINRRELLKLFGIGASVVPLVSGIPEMEAESRLIQVPTLEPVNIPRLKPDAGLYDNLDRLLIGREAFIISIKPTASSPFSFSAHAVITEMIVSPIDITSRHSSFHEYIPAARGGVDISIKTRCLGLPMVRAR